MRTTEFDFAGVENQAKAKKRKRKVIIGSAVAAAVLIPGAAWAAVNIFGFGSFEADAAANGTITVAPGTTSLTKTLAPGETVGVKGNVTNGNDYKITVTDLYVKKSTLAVTGGTPAECDISFAGGVDAPMPKVGGGDEGPNTAVKFTLPGGGVEIPAGPGYTKQIVVNNVIKQASTATKMCGVKADYAVGAKVGS